MTLKLTTITKNGKTKYYVVRNDGSWKIGRKYCGETITAMEVSA